MTSWKTIPADRYDVAVVGGGAAGMTAAIAAARAGARVALLERGERPGRKLLMTGNGKCNLGNRDLKPSHYYSDNMAMAASVLERFGTRSPFRGVCVSRTRRANCCNHDGSGKGKGSDRTIG